MARKNAWEQVDSYHVATDGNQTACTHASKKIWGLSEFKKRRLLRLKSVAIATIYFLLLAPWQAQAQSLVKDECSSHEDCEALRRAGSKCLDFPVSTQLQTQKRCSNPYISGCLANHFMTGGGEEGATRRFDSIRVCNGDDVSTSYCKQPEFDYDEVRIHNGDWESAIFYSWILQIFLSEILQVPARVGLADDTPDASFYNPSGAMSWSTEAYGFDHIQTANRLGGHCERTTEPCVHVLPEVWIGQEKKWRQFLSEDEIVQVSEDGQVGKMSWYIPKYTAERFPNFTTYHGLAGRREQLADIFRTPTSWEAYCRDYSPTNCLSPDDVVERQPMIGEEDLYFHSEAYTGYFRATPESNCTMNPETCEGHIVGAPCTWSTDVDAQTYWNNIALRSSGSVGNNSAYSYSQMIQIWRAANATRSDLVMWWWFPDATIEEFRGTDFEFQPVLLPEPTATCRKAKVEPEDRCSEDPTVRRGVEAGSCDYEVNPLQKVVASSLRDMTLRTPRADRSPGYEAVLNLKVSHLSMNQMLRKWVDGGRSGFAGRDAVCDWVMENQAELERFIPRGYPRTLVYESEYSQPVFKAATSIGGIAAASVMVCMFFVHRWRRIDVLVHAQMSVICLILLGLLLISIGSVVQAQEPQDGICVALPWLTTVGYTLELVPLLVKVATINRLMLAKDRRKHAYLSPRDLSLKVLPLVLIVIVVMTAWTITDPASRVESKELIEADSTVQISVSCSSQSLYWSVIVLSWEGLLILCATVLAFQSRTVKREFNNQNKLGLLIYSHFVFFILRAVVFNVGRQQEGQPSGGSSMDSAAVSAVMSYLLSLDVISALAIYMIPMLLAARTGKEITVEQPIDETSSLNLSVDSTVRRSIGDVGNSSRAVQEIIAKAHAAMTEYKESKGRASSTSRRSSASIIEIPGMVEYDDQEGEDKGEDAIMSDSQH